MKTITRAAKGLPIVPDFWAGYRTKTGKIIFGRGRYKRKGPGYKDEGGTFPREDKRVNKYGEIKRA